MKNLDANRLASSIAAILPLLMCFFLFCGMFVATFPPLSVWYVVGIIEAVCLVIVAYHAD